MTDKEFHEMANNVVELPEKELPVQMTLSVTVYPNQEPLAQLSSAVFDLLNNPQFECLDDGAKSQVLMFIVRCKGWNIDIS